MKIRDGSEGFCGLDRVSTRSDGRDSIRSVEFCVEAERQRKKKEEEKAKRRKKRNFVRYDRPSRLGE